ncbi:superoxide dismutase [Paraburkholderia phenoliruptrix]|uniref:superoxide dismutase n=1 Tax=Paraburkholderia phenoliruptrix TaxID=252970 RepID=UPI001C6E7082|nr:superoxide dismutase [Paraburkholderia phenoliruptrix]MBW9107452.1 superoxide dismutase [Paraburkholderia phenoliruptrix]MBW9128126.1 superoxide dismutase [Paraburkholderia ginsengiterrae]
MKLLCLDVPLPGATMEKYAPHMADEARHAWQMYKGGIIRDIYFRQDRPGVAIIAEAESVEAAKAALDEFPLAQAGLIGWEVIPLGPFTNWETLFASGNA